MDEYKVAWLGRIEVKENKKLFGDLKIRFFFEFSVQLVLCNQYQHVMENIKMNEECYIIIFYNFVRLLAM